ncbi:ABC transporter ATP-binding protein [Cetobacterium sp. 8H]|uniref:ABC transporter ATP-binding protein n=1 Tax=Cetobacterium sp. 8H TaxID=2759681 RepID=UPI00163D21C6|nr:ABC transporter ATP-binding protein [Cetobacterium sp. 8H]MBC2852150.1 ABC transporter ATP-binding protein [Cetobacterium sp. 8H]
MLRINDLTIQYGDKPPVVNNFNLRLKLGEIIGIVGESGSGKSTVIKSIIGALPSDAKLLHGDILFNETDLKIKLDKKRGKDISIIFQDCRNTLNPIRKIGKQYIEYVQHHEKISKQKAKEKCIENLTKMNLSDPENIMNSYPYQLSGGMCQRVGIAIAMTFNPKILLADEPTSALDVTTQSQIIEELLTLRKLYGTSIIIVTHNIGVAAYISDKIIIMKKGNIIEHGDPNEIINSPKKNYTKLLLDSIPKWEEKINVG